MENPVRPLLAALEERGGQPCLQLSGSTLSAEELLAWIRAAEKGLRDLPFPVAAGSIVGIRGLDPRARIAAPIAAWSAGLSTYFLSEREPESQTPILLGQVGCRVWIQASDGGDLDWAQGPGQAVLEGPVSTLLRTSGTSGAAKIAVHDVRQHLASASAAAEYFDLGPGDSWLLSLPTWHVGGLGIVLRTLLSGATLSLPAFDAPLERALEDYCPTHLSLVATQLQRLLRTSAGTRRLAACKAVLVGGGPLPLSLRSRALDADIALQVSYGATETSALIAVSGDPDIVRRPGSAGHALPGRRIEIDAAGQIQVGGPTLFRGYLRDGAVTDPRNDDGLFATGDLGTLDENGILFVHGRADRMFISGGENVQPEEIEAALLLLEGVQEAYVVPRSDTEFGQRPVAFVRLAPGTEAARLAAALRAHLPGFKIPVAFRPLPKTSDERLKVDLAALESLAAADGP